MKAAHWIGGGLTALSFALTAAVYARLPDPMPTHFDPSGRADGFIPKPWGPFVLPLVGLAAYVVTALIPAIRRGPAARRLSMVPVAVAALCTFLVVVVLRTALGHGPELPRTLLAGTSLFIAVVGNYFGKLRRNRWIGIRTPWTLASDEVWLRTHRLGGWLFVLGGVTSCLAALAGAPVAIALAPIAGAVVVPAVFSFVVYRRLRATGAAS